MLEPTLFFFGITILMRSYSWHTTDKVVSVLFCRITTLYYSYCALQIKQFLCCSFSDQLSAGIGLYAVVSLNACMYYPPILLIYFSSEVIFIIVVMLQVKWTACCSLCSYPPFD